MEMMQRIRALMEQRDVNQDALARIAGVSKGSVSHWFAGRVSPKAAMRSSYASMMGEALAPDSVVSGNMGHSDGTTKGAHYQRVTMRAKCAAAGLLADLLAEC